MENLKEHLKQVHFFPAILLQSLSKTRRGVYCFISSKTVCTLWRHRHVPCLQDMTLITCCTPVSICLPRRAGRRCVFSREHEAGAAESELHSSSLGSEGMCSRLLFYVTLPKPVQLHFLPMQRLILLWKHPSFPRSSVCFQEHKKQNSGKWQVSKRHSTFQ